MLMVFGQQQLLRVAAQASPAKQDQCLLTSVGGITCRSFSLNQPRDQPDLETSSPFSTQVTRAVNYPPKTHWIDGWSMTFPFLLPVRLSSSFPNSHITDVAANHLQQILSSKYIYKYSMLNRYIRLEQTLMSPHHFITSEARQAFSIIESSSSLFEESISL